MSAKFRMYLSSGQANIIVKQSSSWLIRLRGPP